MRCLRILDFLSIPAIATLAVATAQHHEPFEYITAVNRTLPIQLRASPLCGDFSSSSFTEVNTGVTLNATKTIVAFGDSWTSNGSNGTIPFAPIVFPPNPSAGARAGNNFRARASNGYVWVEDLANTVGAKLLDYSVGGAVVDLSAWNSTNKGVTFTSDNLLRTDFVTETALFLQQGHLLADLNPDTTLYTVQFGMIFDFNQYSIAGGDWDVASSSFLAQIGILQANGAKNFLIHWVYFQENVTNAFQNTVHQGLQAAHAQNGTNFATVDLANLFTAIQASPIEWGYTNTTCLVSQNFTDFGCDDPDRSIFYIPSHPSATTHEIMNQYTILTIEMEQSIPVTPQSEQSVKSRKKSGKPKPDGSKKAGPSSAPRTNTQRSEKLRGNPARDSPEVRLSKTLSWLLRHGAQSEGLPMRPDGYVLVVDLLANPKLKDLTLETLQEIVKNDSKQRYDLIFEKGVEAEAGVWCIKANQGHSLKSVKLDLQPVLSIADIPTGVAVHGTTKDAWVSISTQGLKRMKRNHIHLAQGVGGGNVISGMRGSSQILIFLDVQRAIDDAMELSLQRAMSMVFYRPNISQELKRRKGCLSLDGRRAER
ncbi:carbohydrate esterase family 16 protein [Favolaschia claudopus]|uniref:2'-phosphotransferase n=1 Tax=Favolaschia claudopus TaxID=2862362 RepID=A0AAW0D778_9AGAR